MLLNALKKTAGRPFDLCGLGECSVDLVYRVPLRLDKPLPDKVSAKAHEVLGGGQIATACAAAARLGRKVRFVGAVGMDGAGQALLAELASDRVDTSLVRRCLGVQTRTALILCGDDGERSVIEWRDQGLTLPPGLPSEEQLSTARVLHVDLCFPDATLAAVVAAKAHGLIVSVDLDRPLPRVDDLLMLTDLCVVSTHFPSRLTGIDDPETAALALSDRTKGRVVVTQGEHGCWLVCDGAIVRLPAFVPPRLVDTTACGDTFHAALICGLLDAADGKTGSRGDDESALRDAIRFASAAAALKCGDLGRRGCPQRAQVDQFLQTAH